MGGALVETSARKLKNEAKREVAVSLLKMGKLLRKCLLYYGSDIVCGN